MTGQKIYMQFSGINWLDLRSSNVLCVLDRGSNMLCVGSADDACGRWTSTSPLLRPLSFLVILSPSSPVD